MLGGKRRVCCRADETWAEEHDTVGFKQWVFIQMMIKYTPSRRWWLVVNTINTLFRCQNVLLKFNKEMTEHVKLEHIKFEPEPGRV